MHDTPDKRLFDYETPQAEAHEIKAQNINPYLVDAADIFVEKRRQPIDRAPPLVFGNMPNDGGNLLLTKAERDEILKKEPRAAAYIRRFIGSEEYINDGERYCLWLQGVSPAVLKSMPLILERIEKVRAHRQASPRATTQGLASVPMLFGEIRQPPTDYLAIPEVSSERRHYIPMGFVSADVIPSNKIYAAAEAALYHFGVLSSATHMAWTRTVCGRLESRYQYSAGIVYNNFAWPQAVTATAGRGKSSPARPAPSSADQLPARCQPRNTRDFLSAEPSGVKPGPGPDSSGFSAWRMMRMVSSIAPSQPNCDRSRSAIEMLFLPRHAFKCGGTKSVNLGIRTSNLVYGTGFALGKTGTELPKRALSH